MRFTKMNGAGNDFILLDAIAEPFDESAASALARSLCDRRRSIGADGLMLVTRAEGDADYRMRFYNSDGSPGEMCGNGARCIARYGYDRGLAGDIQRIETTAGIVVGQRIEEDLYCVRLNDPTAVETEIGIPWDGQILSVSYMELGNPGIPHAVLELPEWDTMPEDELRSLGAYIRSYAAFPKGANVTFRKRLGRDHVKAVTYERGVEDFTLACGTGAGSLAAVLTASGRMDGANVQVQTAGGDLDVEIEMEAGRVENLYLTGAALIVYSGELAEEFLQPVVI